MTAKSLPTACRILVVDDEPMISDLVEGMLASFGYEVEKADNAYDALKMLAGGCFDLVITDYLMPGMKGDELSAAIKAHLPKVPVMLITGLGDTLDSDGKPVGCVNAVLSKPFTREALLSAIGNVLAH